MEKEEEVHQSINMMSSGDEESKVTRHVGEDFLTEMSRISMT